MPTGPPRKGPSAKERAGRHTRCRRDAIPPPRGLKPGWVAMRSAMVKQEGEMIVVTASRMQGTENWMYWRKARDCQRPIFLMNQSGLPADASAEAPAMRREWEE